MPANRTSIPKMRAPESGVTVRMYRTGFGDCFLLAFRGQGGAPVYMLIDCGVHSRYRGGNETMHRIVEHIGASTGGRLDVVAVTHEHVDHISGFHTERRAFERMKVGQVWFGWTEEPGNPAAAALKTERRNAIAALRAAQQSLRAADSTAAGNVGGLLEFFEMADGPAAGGRDELFGLSSHDAMEAIRGKAANPRYLKPKGPPLAVPGVEGCRVFVLGPPVERGYLMASDPAGKRGEVYTNRGLAAAMRTAAGDAPAADDDFQPFAGNYRILADAVREQEKRFPFFHEHYGFGDGGPDRWRRIDIDWQYGAEFLALKLDSATNNTSLALAIELPASRRVLLFPGDAQAGNWESWHAGGWSERNGLAKGERVTAKDLLARTVLYKVAHHGSQNATLREKGLDMMTSPELTAMIPVNQKWAADRTPNSWKMPFGPLYEDLKRRTRGRILRTDCEVAPDAGPAAWGDARLRPREEELYVELTIEDPPAGPR